MLLNGGLLTTLTVDGAPREVAIELPLTHGYNALRFESQGPARAAAGATGDQRPGIALAGVRIGRP